MKGFSLIEIILAVSIFVAFSSAAVVALISGYNANRLGKEFTTANQFASEGIEAVRSIHNQSFASLVNSSGTGIVRNGSGVWEFNGSNNTFDKYTRIITVESIQRDAAPPKGNIVESGGTVDPNTKKVTSTVTWNFSNNRSENVSLTSYLTNWRAPIDGILLRGVSGDATPRVNFYSNTDNTFATYDTSVTGASARNIVVKTSPTKGEAVVAYVDASTLQVMCFDGTTWTNEWNVSVGGTGVTRRFDVAYEYTTGNVMVLYSRNATTNELTYRTKGGSADCGSANWSSATNFDSPGTTGIVSWVKLTADSRSGSNNIAAAWADLNRDLQSAIWNGSAWTQRTTALETTLECRGTCSSPNIPNVDSFDIDFESSSGDIMIVWGSGGAASANGAWYNKCDGSTPPSCTWNASRTAITSMANDATSLDISANPGTDDILFASIGDGGSDLQAARWSGSAWTGSNDLDTSALTPVANAGFVATGWLSNGATKRGIVIFANSGTQAQRIHGFVWNGSTFVRQGTDSSPWFTPTPLLGTPRWFDIQLDPKDTSRLMFLVANSINDLYAKRLEMSSTGVFTWTNPTYTDGTEIETNLTQALASPFYFSYWRNP